MLLMPSCGGGREGLDSLHMLPVTTLVRTRLFGYQSTPGTCPCSSISISKLFAPSSGLSGLGRKRITTTTLTKICCSFVFNNRSSNSHDQLLGGVDINPSRGRERSLIPPTACCRPFFSISIVLAIMKTLSYIHRRPIVTLSCLVFTSYRLYDREILSFLTKKID